MEEMTLEDYQGLVQRRFDNLNDEDREVLMGMAGTPQIRAIGRVLGSLSRPIFMITARGPPSTAPINPQAHPQNATSIKSTIGDISSLSPANCGSTNAPQAC